MVTKRKISDKRNVDSRFQVQMQTDGGGSRRRSCIDKMTATKVPMGAKMLASGHTMATENETAKHKTHN